MPGSLPQVALLIETSKSYGRGILKGIDRYVKEHEPWSMFLEPRALSSSPPGWLQTWQGDGILARVSDLSIAQAVFKANLPAVNLSSALPQLNLPCIESNPRSQCLLAVQHLLERGFRHFAFCGDERHFPSWSDKLAAHFHDLVQRAGSRCLRYQPPTADEDLSWEEQQTALAAWLLDLPKPVGVLAVNDPRGRQVLDACRRAQLAVPDTVAVIGMENDELMCTMADPPLSSVQPNAEQVGYAAAALLTRLMAGDEPPRELVTIEPLGVVARQSTDIEAHEDDLVGRAVRLIRERACRGLDVDELVRLVGVSRSSLDRRFKTTLGRTAKAEILRAQLKTAMRLLSETNLTLTEIAGKAGFTHPEYLGVAFRRALGITPGQYRQTHANLPLGQTPQI